MDFDGTQTTTMMGTVARKLKFNKRSKDERKSVDEIVQILMDIQTDLDTLSTQKDGHLARLEREKKELDEAIYLAATEKERGKKISANIGNLLDV
jgi:hypothetical protein